MPELCTLSIVPTFQRSVVSLPLPREAKPHEQHVRGPAVGKRAERLKSPRLLHRPLRLEIERKVAGAADELQVGDRAIAVHEERHLRLERRALRGPLPPSPHL